MWKEETREDQGTMSHKRRNPVAQEGDEVMLQRQLCGRGPGGGTSCVLGEDVGRRWYLW